HETPGSSQFHKDVPTVDGCNGRGNSRGGAQISKSTRQPSCCHQWLAFFVPAPPWQAKWNRRNRLDTTLHKERAAMRLDRRRCDGDGVRRSVGFRGAL